MERVKIAKAKEGKKRKKTDGQRQRNDDLRSAFALPHGRPTEHQVENTQTDHGSGQGDSIVGHERKDARIETF